MKKTIRRVPFGLIWAMLLIADPAWAQLQGDLRAIALTSEMLEAAGGKQLWAKARSLRIEELSFSKARPEGRRTIFCRDLERPRLSVVEVSATTKTPEYVVGSEQAWAEDEKGNLTTMTAAQKQRYVASWSRNIYVMYHRLARDDRNLSIRLVGDREFTVHEAREEIGRFSLDGRGQLVRWRASAPLNGRDEDWIYGPHRHFGAVIFPDWGTRTDGSYRFYYTRVESSSESPKEAAFKPSWRGDQCGETAAAKPGTR